MGGFKLNGPTATIDYVYETPWRCKCYGLRIDITDTQEAEFMKRGGAISLKEFHALFNNKFTKSHVWVGAGDEPKNPVLKYTVTPKTAE